MANKGGRFTNQTYREARKGSRPTNIRTNQMYDQAGQQLEQLSPQQQQLAQMQMQNAQGKQQAVQSYQDVLQGKAPSLAQAQLKSASDRGLNQQMAQLARARGSNIGMALRQGQQQAGQMNRDLAAQSALTRLQEVESARSGLGQLGGQSEQLLNQSQLQKEEMLRNQQANAAKLRLEADMGKAQNMISSSQNVANYKLGSTAASQKQQEINFAPTGALLQAGGTVGAAAVSDENMKTNIAKESNPNSKSKFDSKDFLSKISANSYKYKPEANEDSKTHFSTMAQDLEKAGPIGKSMVVDSPNGKMVDYGKGFGAILAAQVQLNKRLKDIEDKKKKS